MERVCLFFDICPDQQSCRKSDAYSFHADGGKDEKHRRKHKQKPVDPMERTPDISALVLECANLPVFGKAIKRV